MTGDKDISSEINYGHHFICYVICYGNNV